MLLKKKLKKRGRPFRILLRYAAEVLIIFLGITISFGFDQWREERQKKRDLIELSQSLLLDIESLKVKLLDDRSGSATWITQLDSLSTQRLTRQVSDRQLKWFYRLITGQIYFLFEPHSPTYLSAATSSLYSELPDSIKNDLYSLYQARLPYFQLLYKQQQDNLDHFRSMTVMASEGNLYTTPSGRGPDLEMLAKEIQRPVYGNFINLVILTEREIYKLNESDFKELTELENSLREYTRELKED